MSAQIPIENSQHEQTELLSYMKDVDGYDAHELGVAKLEEEDKSLENQIFEKRWKRAAIQSSTDKFLGLSINIIVKC